MYKRQDQASLEPPDGLAADAGSRRDVLLPKAASDAQVLDNPANLTIVAHRNSLDGANRLRLIFDTAGGFSEVDRLRLTLERVTLGRLDVKELLRSRPAPVLPTKRARISPAISFDSRASESATLIEVVAEDRPGLLYALTSTISSLGANIDVVLIDTRAHKAIDVFYVTSDGKQLNAGQQAELKERLLRACAA